MAALRNQGRAPIGSLQWIIEEREQHAKFRAQELEDFEYTVRNEIEWLNEYMAEIFRTNGVNMVQALKSPVKLRGKTPRTIRKPDLLETAPIALLNNSPIKHQYVTEHIIETIAPVEPEVAAERTSISKSLFEKNSIFDEEPDVVPSSNTSSIGSSPAKPPVRKSSLTFASLPPRPPLPTKKSVGAAAKSNAESTDTTNTEKIPTKTLIAQIKSSTLSQSLQERINLLGKPSKSIVAITPVAPSNAPKTPHVDQELEISKSKFQQIIQSARGRFAEKGEDTTHPRDSPVNAATEESQEPFKDEKKTQASTAGRVISNTKPAPIKDLRRPAKPGKEIAPKTKPQPVNIRVGIPSQRIPQLTVEKKRVEITKPTRPNIIKTMLKPSTKRPLEAETSDPKRRRTRDAEPPNGLRPTMKPPVRPSNMNKKPSKPTHPKDLAKYANGKIPFAEVPNPPSKFVKKSLLSKPTTEDARQVSPASEHGTDISLEEPETSEDEGGPNMGKKPKKKRPTWTNTPELRAQLLAQEFVDTETIFGPLKFPVLEEMFAEFPERHASYRQRGISADWSKDGLTQAEIDFDIRGRKAIRDNGGWEHGLY